MAERNYKYDNMKFFLILCVVIGHLVTQHFSKELYPSMMYGWIYLFHMPAFIFISGLFSKKIVDNKCYDRIVPYVILYIMMESFTFFADKLRGKGTSSLNFLSEDGVPWFALALLWWYLVTILVRKVHPLYILFVSVCLAVIAGYTTEIGPFLALRRTVIFYPFFYVGYILPVDKLALVYKNIYVRIFSVICILGSLALAFFGTDFLLNWIPLFRGRYLFSEIETGLPIITGPLWRIAMYMISFLLTIAILTVIPGIKIPVISRVGSKTLSIYFFHVGFMKLLYAFIPQYKRWLKGGHSTIKIIIASLVITLILSTPIFDWPIRKIMKVPKRKEQ